LSLSASKKNPNLQKLALKIMKIKETPLKDCYNIEPTILKMKEDIF
jgi:hypothetical protein